MQYSLCPSRYTDTNIVFYHSWGHRDSMCKDNSSSATCVHCVGSSCIWKCLLFMYGGIITGAIDCSSQNSSACIILSCSSCSRHMAAYTVSSKACPGAYFNSFGTISSKCHPVCSHHKHPDVSKCHVQVVSYLQVSLFLPLAV